MSDDLKDLRDGVAALRDALFNKLNASTDAQTSNALYLQMLEVSHRVNMVDQLIMTVRIQVLDSNLAQVQNATSVANSAAGELDKVKDIVATIKAVLTVVDAVVDILAV